MLNNTMIYVFKTVRILIILSILAVVEFPPMGD